MFKFLKEKIKQAIEKITHRIETKEVPKGIKEEDKLDEKAVEKPAAVEEKIEKDVSKLEEHEKLEVKEEAGKLEKAAVIEEIAEKIEEKEQAEKKGFFGKLKEKIATRKIDGKEFNELFWELELALLENNVAVEVIDKIKGDLRMSIVDKPVKRSEVDSIIQRSLKKSIRDLFGIAKVDLIDIIKREKERPFIIVFFGTNGSGKTTTISKIANLCLNNNLSVVLGAGDSFRKAAIEQIEELGRRLNVRVIKHQYGADPTAVCFDTVKFARTHNIDVVLLDTAGRQHSNRNLMEELRKIKRVIKPDFSVFIAESIIGNDAVIQAKVFDNEVGIDGIILTKVDVDEKGGAMISMGYITRKPILYLGSGQGLNDLKEFNPDNMLEQLNF